MGKGGGSGGGKPDKSTVSHGNEASGAQTIHASERRWTALSCLKGHDHPMLWDIKPRGNGKPWAMEPAVEDTDGRSASDRTRPRFFFFGLCSTRSPYRGTGFRYRIRLLPGLACGILPDGTIPWLLNRDFKWSTQELDVRRGSVYG